PVDELGSGLSQMAQRSGDDASATRADRGPIARDGRNAELVALSRQAARTRVRGSGPASGAGQCALSQVEAVAGAIGAASCAKPGGEIDCQIVERKSASNRHHVGNFLVVIGTSENAQTIFRKGLVAARRIKGGTPTHVQENEWAHLASFARQN